MGLNEIPVGDEQLAGTNPAATYMAEMEHQVRENKPNPATCPLCGSDDVAILCEVVAEYTVHGAPGPEQDWIRGDVDDDCSKPYGARCRACDAELAVELDAEGLLAGLKEKPDIEVGPVAIPDAQTIPARWLATFAYTDSDNDLFQFSETYDHEPTPDEVKLDAAKWYEDEAAGGDVDFEGWCAGLCQVGEVAIVALSAPAPETPRVLVVVRGGIVVSVMSEQPAEVGIVDFDNAEVGGDPFSGWCDSDPWEDMAPEVMAQIEE